MTNGDRIRQMSNEDLAKIAFGCSKCVYNDQCNIDGKFICTNEILKWLESEVE